MSFSWFKDRQNIAIICLALLILILHLVVINQPDDTTFDEKHYVPEANSIIEREGLLHPEHPSLGKLFIALGITLFGDNAFGWRIFSVLFGIASIILFYLICQSLTTRKYLPIIATFIFATENQSFVQSGVALLDVYSVTLMLASFLLYLRTKYIASGVVLALSALAKVPGAIGAVVILLHWLLTRRSPKRDGMKFLISAPVAFLALMVLTDYIATSEILYPWDRIDYMIDAHSSLTFAGSTVGNSSHPWEWIILPEYMAFSYDPPYRSGINWNMWALIIPTISYAIYGTIKRNSLCMFGLFWFASIYLTWTIIELATDRLMYRFYLYPMIGAICLVLGFVIVRILAASSKLHNRKVRWGIRTLVIAWMISHLVIFIAMGPIL